MRIVITQSRPFKFETRSKEKAEKVYAKIKPAIDRDKMYLQMWRRVSDGVYTVRAGYFDDMRSH